MPLLIAINVFWAVAALIHDLPAIREIPPLAWPFIVICPIYPLGLAWLWYGRWRKRPVAEWAAALILIPASVYGALAAPFYLAIMAYEGFSWDALLGIPWVLAYGAQGWYLLEGAQPTRPAPWVGAGCFMLFSLSLQYATETYGYLGVAVLPAGTQLTLLALGATLSLAFTAYVLARRS